MSAEIILSVKSIEKVFPGVKALDKISFELKKGEVHAIVGENGAGKSTLMHILGGLYKPNAGSIYMDGEKIELHNPADATKKGIGIVFQELSLISELSVAENIYPNNKPKDVLGLINSRLLYKQTEELLHSFGENIDPKTQVKQLSIAKQQVVEILKAISHTPKVLILDEPTSSLTQVEVNTLFSNIRELKKKGMSFIYVSHHLNEIFEVADRVTVLKDGKYVDTLNVKDTNESSIVNLMVGREILHDYVKRQEIREEAPVIQIRDLSSKKHFRNISFEIKKGEIVGFAGLVGAGRTEIAKSLFGILKHQTGEILINGRKTRIRSTKDAIREGIAYTSENRKQEGLFLEMNIAQNCIVLQLEHVASRIFKFLNEKKINEVAADSIKKYRIATPSAMQKVRNLSGGNQQKVLLSMWLGIKPKVLIVDEPTKGVDVGAKSEIYDFLRELADTGVAIMLISSDLLEIIALSDRIIVMKDGLIKGELSHEEASEQKVIEYATGLL